MQFKNKVSHNRSISVRTSYNNMILRKTLEKPLFNDTNDAIFLTLK